MSKKEEIKSYMRKVTRKEHLIALYNSIMQKYIEDELNVYIWNSQLLSEQDKQQKDMIVQSKGKTEALMVDRQNAFAFLEEEIAKEEAKEEKEAKKNDK